MQRRPGYPYIPAFSMALIPIEMLQTLSEMHASLEKLICLQGNILIIIVFLGVIWSKKGKVKGTSADISANRLNIDMTRR
jgi:hypothetical protein